MRRSRAAIFRGALATFFLLALAGCADDVSTKEADAMLGKQMDSLRTGLTKGRELTKPWHQDTSRGSKGCAKGESRGQSEATFDVRTSNDGDAQELLTRGQLESLDWKTAATKGDLDDDPAITMAASRKGDDPAGIKLDATVSGAGDAWHYVLIGTTMCGSTD